MRTPISSINSPIRGRDNSCKSARINTVVLRRMKTKLPSESVTMNDNSLETF